MPGRGPAPKPASQRRRRNVPERGEWRDLAPLADPVLEVAPKDWPTEARELWDVWRQDPVTQTYTVADRLALKLLVLGFYAMGESEQRLRMDGLGLTPKGKKDLRLRPSEDEVAVDGPRLAPVTKLRAVS